MPDPLAYHGPASSGHYVAPRRIAFWRFAAVMVPSLMVVVASGWLYLRVLEQCRWMVVAVAATAIYAAVVGGGAVGVCRVARIMRPVMATLTGVCFGMAALIGIWWFYLYQSFGGAATGVSFVRLILNIHHWPEMINLLAQFSEIKLGDNYHGPGTVIGIWLGEALMIAGIPVGLCLSQISSEILCNGCGRECAHVNATPMFDAEREDEIRAVIESHEFDRLLEFPPLKDDDDPQLNIDVRFCKHCGHTNTISLIRRAWCADAQGNPRIASWVLIDRQLISSDEVELLRALRELHDQAYQTSDDGDEDVAGQDQGKSRNED